MTDRKFQSLLDRTAAAQRKFQTLLREAEAEYARRYGANPSDVDDDEWIDAMTGGCGLAQGMTVAETAQSARNSGLNVKAHAPCANERREK